MGAFSLLANHRVYIPQRKGGFAVLTQGEYIQVMAMSGVDL